jgi:deoxyadenosine/deoxycytidine kinase
MTDFVTITASGPAACGKTTLLRFLMLQLAEYGILEDDDIASIAQAKRDFLPNFRELDGSNAEAIEFYLDERKIGNIRAAMDAAADEVADESAVMPDYFAAADLEPMNQCSAPAEAVNRVVVEHNVDARVIDALGWIRGGLSSAFAIVEENVSEETDEVQIVIRRK